MAFPEDSLARDQSRLREGESCPFNEPRWRTRVTLTARRQVRAVLPPAGNYGVPRCPEDALMASRVGWPEQAPTGGSSERRC